MYYFRIEQAEEIKNQYSSWIGKPAHVGKGATYPLKNIHIHAKKVVKKSAKVPLYRIEFEFEGSLKLGAHEFLFYNGLTPHRSPSIFKTTG